MFLYRSAIVKQVTMQAEAITHSITRYALNFHSSFGYPFTSLDITFVSSHVNTITISLFPYHQAIWSQFQNAQAAIQLPQGVVTRWSPWTFINLLLPKTLEFQQFLLCLVKLVALLVSLISNPFYCSRMFLTYILLFLTYSRLRVKTTTCSVFLQPLLICKC